jgi:hypothetical protein
MFIQWTEPEFEDILRSRETCARIEIAVGHALGLTRPWLSGK